MLVDPSLQCSRSLSSNGQPILSVDKVICDSRIDNGAIPLQSGLAEQKVLPEARPKSLYELEPDLGSAVSVIGTNDVVSEGADRLWSIWYHF